MAVSRPPPAVDVIPSEEILQHLHPSLLQLDFNSPWTTTTIIAGTTIAFTAILFVSMFLSNLFPTFRVLRTKHRVFMALAVARGTYGFCCMILGSYALFTKTNLDRDVVFGKTATSTAACYFTLGFFIFELSAVIISDVVFKTFSKMLIIHHGLAGIGYSLLVGEGAGHTFGTKSLLLEMSTPFSCMCFALLKAGKENSLAWKINQILLVHTFHMRSVIECHMWYITISHWAYIWEFMPAGVFTLLYSNLTLITFVMTPYWGYKKTQQLFNPVDWNFQESRSSVDLTNGDIKKDI